MIQHDTFKAPIEDKNESPSCQWTPWRFSAVGRAGVYSAFFALRCARAIRFEALDIELWRGHGGCCLHLD
jgi:hypothetical protein